MADTDLHEQSAVCSSHLPTVFAGYEPVDDVKICRICFASKCKLYPMSIYKTFSEAYETLTGLSIHDNLPTYLCIECAQQLLNCLHFRNKSLRAYSTLLDIVKNHGYMTLESIQPLKGTHSPLNLNTDHKYDVVNLRNFNARDIISEVTQNSEVIDNNNDNAVDATNNDMVWSRLLEDDNVYNIKVGNETIIHNNPSAVYVTHNDTASNLPDYGSFDDIKIENNDIVNYQFINTVDVTKNDTVNTANGVENDVADSSKYDWRINQHTANKESTIDYTGNKDVIVDEDEEDSILTEIVPKIKRNSTGVQEVNEVSKETVQAKVDTCRDLIADGGIIVTNTLSCDICSYRTNIKRQFFSHLKAHAASKPYACNVCSFITIRRLTLINHLKIHSRGKIYSRDVCNKTCKGKSAVTKHLKVHSREILHSCDMCNKRFTSKKCLTRHLRTHSGEKPYLCKICNKAFHRKEILSIHLRTHSREKPYSCNACDKVFAAKNTLREHLRIHSGEKPYSCKVCNKAFVSRSNLIRHKKIHSGERPYSCKVCYKAFVSKHNLQGHFRIHSGEKPYSCKVCNKAFTQKGHVKKHLSTHSGEKPYICDICNKALANKSNLKEHLKAH